MPGGHVYYEVRGSGPVMLMMPGGPADAAPFRKIEHTLAPRYTVVTSIRAASPTLGSGGMPAGTESPSHERIRRWAAESSDLAGLGDAA